MSVVRLSRAAIPHMRARGGGRMIHVTSISVKQPIDGLVLSNALRAAVTGLAKTLAIELAPDNILVNCVAPGYTRTDRVVELADAAAAREGVAADVVQRRTEEKIPLGRMGTPEEFGAASPSSPRPRRPTSRARRCRWMAGSSGACYSGQQPLPRGFAPRTPLHALSLAASPARSVRVAHSLPLIRVATCGVRLVSGQHQRS
jgi:NAD(P)-dependent dehydrogenase (short-subunit alcohol dehydrogenase family)